MNKFAELTIEDIRLVILRGLSEATGYSQNESIVNTILGMFGHHISRDQVRTHLVWLREQGLVDLDEVVGYYVATLTGRGADVAAGCATCPGVKRPSPRG